MFKNKKIIFRGPRFRGIKKKILVGFLFFLSKKKGNFDFCVFALRRSGQHAIIDWILRQAEGYRIFLNNVNPDDPFTKGYGIEVHYDGLLPGIFPRMSRDLLLYNLEDKSIDKFCFASENVVGVSNKKFKILIVRDPFNLVASRMKFGECNKKNITPVDKDFLSNWLDNARLAVSWLDNPTPGNVFINYNTWRKSDSYRGKILKEMGLNFKDDSLEFVPVYGGGSSFDKRTEDGRRMEVDSRWKFYKDNSAFIDLFKNAPEDFIEVGSRLFPEEFGDIEIQRCVLKSSVK